MEAKYVFATFLTEVKKAWKGRIAQEKLIDMFFDAVLISGELKEQYKDQIVVDKTYASRVFNRQQGGNVKQQIREHIDDMLVRKNLPGYFEKNIMVMLNESAVEGLIYRLNILIQDDEYISAQDRESMCIHAEENEYALFLSRAFVLSLLPLNALEDRTVEEYSADLSVEGDLAILYEKYEKVASVRKLPGLDKPEIPVEKEAPYISELYKAYGSCLQRCVQQKADLSEELQEDFEERRDDFYAAETVHLQGVGIISGLTGDEFDKLKEETCRTVKFINRKALMDKLNGYDCMTRVLEAAQTTMPTNNLFYKAGYVGPDENRGICQMLAGEKKLHWVKDNE